MTQPTNETYWSWKRPSYCRCTEATIYWVGCNCVEDLEEMVFNLDRHPVVQHGRVWGCYDPHVAPYEECPF